MIRTVSAIALIALGATYALAQATGAKALEERKALMKQVLNEHRIATGMSKADPFNLAKAQNWLKVLQANVSKAKGLFPDDSKGGETRATPAVWTNRADFNAKFDGFDRVVKAATSAVKDEASFKAEYPKVNAACDSCHKDYRASSKK